jgi:hypothetical protein
MPLLHSIISRAVACAKLGEWTRMPKNMDANDEKASQVLSDVERSERDILDLYQKHSRGPIGYQHFYLFGIARRALAQSAAFRKMIASASRTATPL